MYRQNDQTSAMYTGIGLVAGVAIAVGLFFLALLAFSSFVMTILALCAWNKPLQLGRTTLEPQAARAFVLRGVAGTLLVPAFTVFCSILFDFTIEPEAWPYLFLGGYVAGSIGVAILMADDEEEAIAPPASLQSLPRPIASPPQAPRTPTRPFDFADWDDDELR